MMNRRNFIEKLGVAATMAPAVNLISCKSLGPEELFIATWNNRDAVEKARSVYLNSRDVLTAVEKGINLVENNPKDRSVGLGGRPDRDGNVSLDACIMDNNGKAGSVSYVQNLKNPVSIARAVMEKTPHVILAGLGAEKFAMSQGFTKVNLLTPESEKEYKEWLKESEYKPIINIENHDTIGLLGWNKEGVLAGGCSTSGLSYKMAGRVGDSPIIGAGLFVDGEIGACVATGLGEKVLTALSSFLVVELIRQGKSPTEACKIALERIIKKEKVQPDFQVGLIAINSSGEYGGYALFNGFNYAVSSSKGTELVKADHFFQY